MSIIDIVMIVLAAIAAINLGIGCLLTIEKILKTFGSKSTAWMYVYIIITSIGIVALATIIRKS